MVVALPLPHCTLRLAVRLSWVKVGSSVSPVRGTRVLDGVSSPRPDSVDSATLCARTLLGATPIAQPDNNASTPDDRACSSEDFGERRANAGTIRER